MRAGRLVSLMLILQRTGQATAAQLADELEVSQRTILRDIEELSGAGVPVYAMRGPGGGFALLDGFEISPRGCQLAAVLRVLQPLRATRAQPPDDDGWIHATCRIVNLDATANDVLALSPTSRCSNPPR